MEMFPQACPDYLRRLCCDIEFSEDNLNELSMTLLSSGKKVFCVFISGTNFLNLNVFSILHCNNCTTVFLQGVEIIFGCFAFFLLRLSTT